MKTTSPTRLARTVSAATIAGLLLAGCTQPAPSAPPVTPTSAASTPTVSATASPRQSEHEPLGAADQIKVVAQAESFLRALARSGTSREAWWAGVEPYLTASAAQKLRSLKPSSVGFTRVSGSGELMPETAGDRATDARTVVVPTDAGRFAVKLTDPTGLRLVSGFGPEGATTMPSTTTDQSSDGALTQFAAKFMRAFAKPASGVSTRQWWERIARMLTDDAIDTYADITPDAVAVRRVTGPIKVEPLDALEENDDIRAVTIGTDAGTYRLIIQPPTPGVSNRPLVIEIQEP